MAHQRSIFAGMTDYTAVSLDDLLEHIRNFRDWTKQDVDFLERAYGELDSKAAFLDDPEGIRSFIAYFHDLLTRVASEFNRLLEELPQGVMEAHVEAVKQLFASSLRAEDRCIEFKRNHVQRGVGSRSARSFVDEVYGRPRQLMHDLRDLSNMAPRLRALVGTSPLVTLRPEFHGIGVDLMGVWRRLLRRLREWFS